MKTTIQINGKLYDAKTGKVIVKDNSNQISSRNFKPISPRTNGIVMDGVARRKSGNVVTNLNPNHVKPKLPLPKTSQPYATDIFKPKTYNNAHKPNNNRVHSAQKSQTLNRKAVKKPIVNTKLNIYTKVSTPVATMHSRVEHSATGRGMLLKKIPQNRLVRAINAPKSNLVSKFGQNRTNKPQLSPHLKVQQTPFSNQPKVNEPQLKNPVHQIDSAYPNIKRSVFEDHLIKSNTTSSKVKKDNNLKKYKKFRLSPKLISLTAVFIAFVLMSGFFAYQNIPSVGMRIAAQKAGFNGSLPGSLPSGYAFKSPIVADSNNITVTYKNDKDNRNFVLVQRPTNWSSESLLTNYLLDSQYRYQVYRDKGLTVYIYNGSNATWVDKGVWYSVTSDENTLSSEQLLELASSI